MFTEYSDDDALYHHGVLGMKWGRRMDGGPQGHVGTFPKRLAARKGKKATGLSRARSARLDKNQRRVASKTRRLNKEHRTAVETVRQTASTLLRGKEGADRALKQKIAKLNAQDSRIKSGQVTVKDRISLTIRTSVASLVVSKRNTRTERKTAKAARKNQ